MEVSLAVRIGYFSALNGNITSNSDVVPVYDSFAIPEDVTYPYILLSTQVEVQRQQKQCKAYDANILIDIVTGSTSLQGRMESELIADQIENIINPEPKANIDITANGYEIGATNRMNGTDINSKNNQFYVVRKLIRYNHIICKL